MVKRRLKSIISTVLVAAMLTTMAPQAVCGAAETAWKIVKNQETPLDEVYFDCKKSDDATKSYLYGFIDGKVAIIDSDYKLIKKTDYDEIAAMKKKVNGVTAYIVSKKVGEEKVYGIISEKGETIIEPKYAYIWSGDNAIQITGKVNGQKLVGLLSYDDGKQIIPCKYNSIWSIAKKDDNMLVITIGTDGSSNAILDGKLIITKKRADEDERYYFYFSEYDGQKYILCRFIPKSGENDTVWSYYSYDGKLIKKMSNDEYRKNQSNNEQSEEYIQEKTYKEACDKWLDKSCEDGKKHVQEFYKSKNIMLNDVESKSYYMSDYRGNVKYYWNIITGKYENTDGKETENINIVYSYIYDTDGKCLLSGRSFLNVADNNKADQKKLSLFEYERVSRYLLSDSDWICYLNKDTDSVEELFEIKGDRLPNMLGYFDDDSLENEHYLFYDYGNIIETGNGYKRIFVYKDKKIYSYDYNYDKYYFVKNGNGVKMYQCGLTERNLDTLEKEGYEGNIEWTDYGKLDIGIDELAHSSIHEIDTGLLVNNKSSRKIYYFGKNKQFIFSDKELGIPKLNKDVSEDEDIGEEDYFYVRNTCGCKNWLYFCLKTRDGVKYYYCLKIADGTLSKVSIDDNSKEDVEEYYSDIVELGDRLYLYSSTYIASIDKKSFKAMAYTLNINEKNERIHNIFMLNDSVYVQYEYSGDCVYYGILDLSGKKCIDASLKKYNHEFIVCGNYLTNAISNGSTLYDSSLNPVSGYVNLGAVYDNKRKDSDGFALEVDKVYKIVCYNKISSDYETYVSKLAIFDKNINKIIYEENDNVYLEYFTKVDKYYIMSIHNKNSKTTKNIKRVIIDSTNGEQLYSGDGYVYVDELNHKLVIIKNSPYSISIAEDTVKVKAGKSINIDYSAYNSKDKKVKAEAASSNTKVARVSVLSNSRIKITVTNNAKNSAVSYIMLTNGNKKITIKVIVEAEENKVSKLKVKTKKVNINKGKKLSVIYNYSAQNNKKPLTEDVKIKSSDESIVKITGKKISNGKITVKIKAVNKGKVDITVKVGSKSASTKVTVK